LFSPITFSRTRVLDVDAFENHGELRGSQLDASLGRRRRDAKAAEFETLDAGITAPPFQL